MSLGRHHEPDDLVVIVFHLGNAQVEQDDFTVLGLHGDFLVGRFVRQQHDAQDLAFVRFIDKEVFERRAHDVFLGKAEMQFGPLVEFEDEPVDVGGKNDVGGVLEDAVEVIGLVLYPPDRQHDFSIFCT